MSSAIRYIWPVVSLIAYINPALAQTTDWDEDAIPIRRERPIFPEDLDQSGYCCLKFDINTLGKTTNIRIEYCTTHKLMNTSKTSVSKWQYKPAQLRGDPILRRNATTKLSFNYADNRGLLIAGPTGYLDPKSPLESIPLPPQDRAEYRLWADKYFHTEKPCGEFIS